MKHVLKRSLALLLLLAMILSMVPATFAQEAQGNVLAEAGKTPLTEGDPDTLPDGEKPATKGSTSSAVTHISLNPVTSGGEFIIYDSEAAFADLWNQESFDNRFFYFVRKGYNDPSERFLGLVNYYGSGEDRGSMHEHFLNFGTNNFTSGSVGFVNLGLYPTRFSVHLEKNPDVPNQFYISTYASSTEVPSGFTEKNVNQENYRIWPVDQVRYFSIPRDLATGTDYLPNIEEYWSESDSERTPFYYSSTYGLVGDLKNGNQAVMLWKSSYVHIHPIVNGGIGKIDDKTMLGEIVQYVNTQALHDQITTVQNWFGDYYETGIEDLYNPALFAELEALVLKAADFYNNEANGKNMTLELQAEVDQMTEALKKLLQEVQKSILSVDIPVTFYDFRSDGLMFEANGGEYYAYMMENPGNSPSKGKPFPGIKGGTLTDAGYGTKTMGLVENKLVNGQLVYKEATIEYLAWLIALGYCREFPESQGMVNRELYRKVKEISATAGTDTNSEKFLTALGTWDGTLAKANDGDESKAGYNGGYFNYSEVETAFDLAYYIATNIWRPVAEDDIMEQVTVTNEDETETVFDLPYSLTVEEYDYLRLIKDTTTGAYSITAYSPLVYQPADEENSVGLIYNTDLKEKQPIGNGDMRFIPLGGDLHADKGQSAQWLGFDALGSEFEDNTDLGKNEGFHFAMHAYGSFVYQRSLNQYFYFLGDDDVYYFIDGKLVMDLGGGHPPCDDILYLNDVAKDLGLVDGGVYSFDMFYTERHTSESNIAFSTNIQIMDTNTITTEQQFNQDGVEIPAGTKVEIGDPITYRYGLQNTRDVPVKNLVFTDPALGVTISGNVCLLNGEVNPQVGGNEETDVSNLILYYYGKNSAPADAVEMSFGDIRTLLTNILEKPTNQNEYASFDADDAFYVTGLSADNLMELMALGLPVNCGLFVHGFKRVAKFVDQPFTSELYTSCEYEKALFGTDGSFEVQPITINGSATVSTMVRPDPVFSAERLRYVIDYGKPLEINLDRVKQCVVVPDSILYKATTTFIGIKEQGSHQEISMERPRNLLASSVDGKAYPCAGVFGTFERKSLVNSNGFPYEAIYYTPSQFLENVARAYGVFEVMMEYKDPETLEIIPGSETYYYITVSLEIIPATMMYYEAEDFFPSEITYEEQIKNGKLNTTPGIKTDSELVGITITDPTPAQDTHYAEGKTKDTPGNHIFMDFTDDDTAAARYNDKAYYFGQEQINWDDPSCWKKGDSTAIINDGKLYAMGIESGLETNQEAGMLNLPMKHATFLEIKAMGTASESPITCSLITVNHVGVKETVNITFEFEKTNEYEYLVADLNALNIENVHLKTLVGIKLAGAGSMIIDYIFAGPVYLAPHGPVVDENPYFFENFYNYLESYNYVPKDKWEYKATLLDNTTVSKEPKINRMSTAIAFAHLYPNDFATAEDNYVVALKEMSFRSANGLIDFPLKKAETLAIYLTTLPTFPPDSMTHHIYLTLEKDGNTFEVEVPYGETQFKTNAIQADLADLQSQYGKATIRNVEFKAKNANLPGSVCLSYVYLGPKDRVPVEGGGDWERRWEIPEVVDTQTPPPTPPVPSTGKSLFADFAVDPNAGTVSWKYWKLKEDVFKNETSPEIITDEDDYGHSIMVMKMEFDNPGSAESRFQIDGLNIPYMENPSLNIRMKIKELFKWTGYQQAPDTTSFKVELLLTNGSTIELTRDVDPADVGKYIDHQFDLRDRFTGDSSNISSIILHFDAWTSIPQFIYLDYVYLGDYMTRPDPAANSSEDYIAQTNSYMLQMEAEESNDPALPENPDQPGSWIHIGEWANGVMDRPATVHQPQYTQDEGISALKTTFTDNSWRAQIEGTITNGKEIPVRDAEFAEVRIKVSGLHGTGMNSTSNAALKLLYVTTGGNLEFDAQTISAEGQYCIVTFDLTENTNILTSTQTLKGLHLFIEPFTAVPTTIYLDYVYVGPKDSSPSHLNSIYPPYEEIYGFDSTYTNDRYLSNSKSLYIKGQGVRLPLTEAQYEAGQTTGMTPATGSYSEFQFSFSGTGFDLISRTGADQGTIRVTVFSSDRRTEESRLKAITVINKGDLELYQIPVVSIQGLPYGTYYVTVGVNAGFNLSAANLFVGSDFYFDALRIYDPIDTSANAEVLDAYIADGEAYPHIKEIRDTLLTVSDFEEVFLGSSTKGAIFVDTTNFDSNDTEAANGSEATAPTERIWVTEHVAADVSTYNKVGPKNEVYLSPGQAVAFKLALAAGQVPTSIDISAKSILGDTAILSAGFVTAVNQELEESTLKFLDGTTSVIKSATSQYYPVALSTLPTDAKDIYLVIYNGATVSNSIENILSITDLKVCYSEAPSPADNLPTDDNINNPEIHPTRAIHQGKGMSDPYTFMVDGRTLEAAAVFIRTLLETPIVDEGAKIMHSLNLESDIALNYVVQKDTLAGYDTFYLECIVPHYEGNSFAGQDIVRIDPVEKNGDFYYFTLSGLTAVQMNDTIQASLHMEKDGKTYCSKADTYSISQYAYSQLVKKNSSKALKTLCADLLRYGAKAQTYKGYRVDCLADQAMTTIQRSYLSDIEAVTFGNHNTVKEDLAAPAVTWEGKALSLDSRVTIRLMFNTANYEGSVEDLTLRIRYKDRNGTEQTAILTDAVAYRAGKSIYAFDFADLAAAELRSVLEATIYAGDKQVSNTLVYSADTYGNNKTGTLLTLCKALFAYADSARAYFA